ncbi:MAG: PhoU domain-containing protein [Phycisphaerales bacterium]|nr:PhoU domain-containing protein [Phycisphaerales bacterium]
MTITPDQFQCRLARVRSRLVDQGELVIDITEQTFETIYNRDAGKAALLMQRDDEVDQADIEIERDAVDMLTLATKVACPIEPAMIRSLLTAVKVNNELERIADSTTAIAQLVITLGDRDSLFPKTTRVMTNSIVGILRDTVKAFKNTNADKAKSVLACEGNTLAFHELIARDAESRVADGRMGVDTAFSLHAIINQAVLMGDHCTNIAEQVIYEATGTIVRHTTAGWVEQNLPNLKNSADTE